MPFRWILILFFCMDSAFADPCDQIAEKACGPNAARSSKDATGSVSVSDAHAEIDKLVAKSDGDIRATAANLTRNALQDPQQAQALREWAGAACKNAASSGCRAEVQKRVQFILVNDLYDQSPLEGKSIPSQYAVDARGLAGSTVSQLVNSSGYLEQKSALLKSMTNGYAPAGRFEKIRDTVFPQVQDSFQDALDNMSLNPATRDYIQKHVGQTGMSSGPCNDNPELTEILSPGMELKGNGIVVCPGYLRDNSSQFKNMFVLGHEMSHSFDAASFDSDPARTGAKGKEIKASYDKVLRCLSKKMKTGNDPQLQHQLKTEVWSDFWGTEVLASWMKTDSGNLSAEQYADGVANVLRGFCSEEAYAQHPPTKKRYEIILSHPEIRAKLKCAPLKTEAYCGSGLSAGGGSGAKDAAAPQSSDK